MFVPAFRNTEAEFRKKIEEEIRLRAPYRLPSSNDIRNMPLSFYGGNEGYQLISLRDLEVPPPNERFLLFKTGAPAHFLDWSNKPIYELNDTGALQLRRTVLIDYTEFFFHFVRGQLGRFIFISNLDQAPWRPELSAKQREDAKKKAREALRNKADEEFRGDVFLPRYAGHKDGDFYVVRGIVAFKNALFQTDVLIAPYPTERKGEDGTIQQYSTGQLELTGERLLDEEFPFVIDEPPGEFG